MAKTTSFTAFKAKTTAAQLKTANSIAIDIPKLPASGKGYSWSIAMAELRGSLPKVLHLKVLPFSLLQIRQL